MKEHLTDAIYLRVSPLLHDMIRGVANDKGVPKSDIMRFILRMGISAVYDIEQSELKIKMLKSLLEESEQDLRYEKQIDAEAKKRFDADTKGKAKLKAKAKKVVKELINNK